MNLRWVNWKEFETRPPLYGALSEIIMKEVTGGAYTQGFKLDSYQRMINIVRLSVSPSI